MMKKIILLTFSFCILFFSTPSESHHWETTDQLSLISEMIADIRYMLKNPEQFTKENLEEILDGLKDLRKMIKQEEKTK